MNLNFKLIILLLAAVCILISNINFTQAENLGDAFDKVIEVAGSEGAGYQTDANPETLIGQVIRVIISFVGVIFLVLMIYGGYLWMLARGNDQQVEKAKNLITAAIIGLIIVLAAYAITYILIDKIGSGVLVEDVLEG